MEHQETILLTGASGFLGVHLLRELSSPNNAKLIREVRTLDRHCLPNMETYFGKLYCQDISNM
jgi:thioester reductase-like protein